MYRKRASPAPAFRQPSAYNPLSGQHAPLGVPGIISRIAMMQIIEDDTHEKYVVCRGYDPETRKFYHRLNVGKPYGLRGTYPYRLAQVFPAIKARTQLRDTPGMAEYSVGHPADLDEKIVILTDEEGNPIWWLLLDTERGAGELMVIHFEVLDLSPYFVELSTGCNAVLAKVLNVSCNASSIIQVGDEVIVYDPDGCWFNVPAEVLIGAHGTAVWMEKGAYWDIPDCVDEEVFGVYLGEQCWWLVQQLCCLEEVYNPS